MEYDTGSTRIYSHNSMNQFSSSLGSGGTERIILDPPSASRSYDLDPDEFYEEEEYNKERIRKKRNLLITAITVVALVLAAAVIYLLLNLMPLNIMVPAFKTRADVLQWIDENHLKDNDVFFTYEFSEEINKDNVITQSSEAGSTIRRGSELTVTLSKGLDPDKEFVIPDFSGKDLSEVKKYFTDHHFTNVTYTAVESDLSENTFVEINPAVSSKVKRSDSIEVKYAGAGTEITVPDYSSFTRNDLQNWADENKVSLNITEQYSDTVAAGNVISLSANTGDTIHAGDNLDAVISLGTENQPQEEKTAEASDSEHTAYTYAPSNTTSQSSSAPAQNSSYSQPAAPQPVTYSVPSIDTTWYDGWTASDIENAISSVVSNSGIPGNVNYVISSGDYPGVSSITASGTQVTDASQITVVISQY